MAKLFFTNAFIYTLVLNLAGCTLFGLEFGEGKSEGKDLGGIFKSIDKGITFIHKAKSDEKASLTRVNVISLQFDPKDTLTVYVLTKASGLWVSNNSGENFEQLINGTFQAFALDPKIKGTIYLTRESELLRSSDDGSIWETLFTETSGNPLRALAVDPNDSAHVITVTKNGAIFESADFGISWKLAQKLNVQTVRHLLINPSNSLEMYLTTSVQGLFKTTDGGKNWLLIDSLKNFKGSSDYGQLKINPENPSHLFLASKYGILKSIDSGKTWTEIKLLTAEGANKVMAMGFNSNTEREIYYATRESFYVSHDGGETWRTTSLPTRRYPSEIMIDRFDPHIIYIAVTND